MADRYRTILLFGAPGSGKGTQGKIIGQIPGFHHSSTGDIFRSLDLQSEMGRKFWEYAGRGELVPDEFTIALWSQYIKGLELINQFHPGDKATLTWIDQSGKQQTGTVTFATGPPA